MNEIADSRVTASFFDRSARDYDRTFSQSRLGQDLRAIVWDRIAASFKAGDRVLELNCGTGEDAVWMAKRGIRVLGTDISDEMLRLTLRKAAGNGVMPLIDVLRLDIDRLEKLATGERFDGALSNFGGLNCTRALQALASALAARVVPGGTVILVFMSRYCAWEIAWHSLRVQPATAFRRLRPNGVEARLGPHTIRVWYPSTGFVRRAFMPWFELKRVTGLGVFLPPTCLARAVAGCPRFYRVLEWLERRLAGRSPFSRLGDHTICEFRRSGDLSRDVS